MGSVKSLIENMVGGIVDDPISMTVSTEETDRGTLYEIKVGKEDIGKIIGKKGRVASAIRTVAKAAGAKQGIRVMVNVFNRPAD